MYDQAELSCTDGCGLAGMLGVMLGCWQPQRAGMRLFVQNVLGLLQPLHALGTHLERRQRHHLLPPLLLLLEHLELRGARARHLALLLGSAPHCCNCLGHAEDQRRRRFTRRDVMSGCRQGADKRSQADDEIAEAPLLLIESAVVEPSWCAQRGGLPAPA